VTAIIGTLVDRLVQIRITDAGATGTAFALLVANGQISMPEAVAATLVIKLLFPIAGAVGPAAGRRLARMIEGEPTTIPGPASGRVPEGVTTAAPSLAAAAAPSRPRQS
jgi:hypothetical protein